MAATSTAMSWRPAVRGRQWTGFRLSCDVDLAFAFVAAMPAALALGILVGSDAKLEDQASLWIKMFRNL
jgi:ABC-type nitrate/sulfonate/bicarbonate transport system permease component